MPSSHLILCRPLLLLPSIPPSIRVFSNESTLRMRWPKYWSFSFNISPSNEHPGLISFRMDWLDLLAVQGTLKSLLQYHSSKASVLQHSAFFTVQLSHPYMTTGKTIALTRRTFVVVSENSYFSLEEVQVHVYMYVCSCSHICVPMCLHVYTGKWACYRVCTHVCVMSVILLVWLCNSCVCVCVGGCSFAVVSVFGNKGGDLPVVTGWLGRITPAHLPL